MWITRLMAGYFFLALAATGCTGTADKQAGDKAGDSVVAETPDEMLFDESCYNNFFTGLPKFKDSLSALLLLESGKKATLTQFFRDEYMSTMAQYGTKDLDGDGTIELVIYNNTGGAHCCDEYYIFQQKAKSEFRYQGQLVSGQVCVDAATNIFTYSFTETYGYFFGCYACTFQDSTGVFKSMREIQLRFSKNKFEVVPYDTAAEKQNILNLQVLYDHGYEELEGMMDNGLRKEFAMNFAVWHFNHGQDWKKTKKLFDQYYHFNDAVKIWMEFYNILKEVSQQNSF
jgi:hypothetical protein